MCEETTPGTMRLVMNLTVKLSGIQHNVAFPMTVRVKEDNDNTFKFKLPEDMYKNILYVLNKQYTVSFTLDTIPEEINDETWMMMIKRTNNINIEKKEY